MNVRLLLRDVLSRPWHRRGAVHATGAAYTDAGPLDGPALAAHLDGPALAFAARARALSGHFAAVLETPDGAALAVDRIASTPLFYALAPEGVVVGTEAAPVGRAVGARVDDDAAVAELLLASAPVGPRTLSTAVRRVQAGEVVHLGPEGARAERYFRYAAGGPLEGAADELEAEGTRHLEQAFEALLASVRGRPLVVPLSGGYDSRLVAALLVRGGRTDAVCYGYGRRGSLEARASRAVARALGLRWHFVPYTAPGWWRASASEGFARLREGAALAGIEHGQDWLAVETLARRGVLPPEAVVVPGHAGDFLGGSHLPPTPVADPVDAAWQRYYVEWPGPRLRDALRERLRARIAEPVEGLAVEAAVTSFGWQERQAKLIAPSVRVFEAFGLDWRMPFWADAEALDFWGRVPPGLLRRRALYDAVLRRLLGPLWALPSTHRPVPPGLGRVRRALDADQRRYGIWLGPAPELRGLVTRVADLARVEHPVIGPVVQQVTAPLARWPLQRVPLNGLVALRQLREIARGWL